MLPMMEHLLPQIFVLTARAGRPVPTRLHRKDMVVAGDADLAGDNQGHQCVRNSVAHTQGPLSTAAAALNADEPEMTKVTSMAEKRKWTKAPQQLIQRGAQLN